MSTEYLQGFYLDDLFVDPLRGRVSDKDVARHLPPKAVEVLLCLVKTPGELVTRDTLLDEVWGHGHGSTEALSHAVSEIRHALGDQPESPRYIQTLPKRGYRLLVAPQDAPQHTESIVFGGRNATADIGLFENLQRRGVLETAIAYLVFGWLVIQVADIVFAQLHLPLRAGTFVTILVIAGFPIALALSWFLEFRDGRAILHELSPRDARRRQFSRTYVSVVAAMATASALVFLYDRQIGLPVPEISPPPESVSVQLPPVVENSLAVLPFANLDGSNDTQLFADGLVEDVITQLSRVPGLRVAARGDSYTLKPNSASQDVRNRLRVEKYLEGSVEMNAAEMRVTVQLIDSADGFHIVSRRFDKPREDFFEVRDEITSLTVANVRIALPPDQRSSSLKVVEDPSLNAYVLYRHGVETSRQPISIDTIASAVGWFDAALYVDPEYAAAHAGKCTVYVMAFVEVGDANYISLAESACATALTLNPNLDVVHAALGDLYVSTGHYRDAETAYQQAIAMNPSNAAALIGLGRTYQLRGQLDEAEATLRKAVDIHPGDAATYSRLAGFLYENGRYEEATILYQYLVAFQPDNMRGYSNLASAYMLQGDFTAAASAFQMAIDIEPTQYALSNLGLMYYYLGNIDAAIETHLNAVELQPNDHLTRSNLGDALAAAGRTDESLQQFEIANTLATALLEVNPNDPLTLMDLAWIKTALDRHDEARTLIDRARSMVPTDPYVHYIEGLMFNRVGNMQKTIAALTTAVESGYPIELLAGDPNLADLRDNPHFKDILDAAR